MSATESGSPIAQHREPGRRNVCLVGVAAVKGAEPEELSMATPSQALVAPQGRIAATRRPGASGRTNLRPVSSRPTQSVNAICTSVEQVEAARARIARIKGAVCVVPVDPRLVRPSIFADRLESAYLTSEFQQLVQSIARNGINSEPVTVRPVRAAVGSSNGPVLYYELASGHLRHQACLNAGAPVVVAIREMTDAELYKHLIVSNRNRHRISPIEAGRSYCLALKLRLFKTQQAIANAIGVDKSMVSEGVRLGLLPLPIVQAFHDATTIQYDFAKPLSDAIEVDARAVIARALSIRKRKDYTSLKPQKVCDLLTGLEEETPEVAQVRVLVGKKVVLSLVKNKQGKYEIRVGEMNANARAAIRLLFSLMQCIRWRWRP